MAPIKNARGSNQYKKTTGQQNPTLLQLNRLAWHTAEERSKDITKLRADRQTQQQQKKEHNLALNPELWTRIYNQAGQPPLTDLDTAQMVQRVHQHSGLTYTFDEQDQIIALAMRDKGPLLTLSYKQDQHRQGSLGWIGVECAALAIIADNPQEQWSAPTLSATLDSISLNTNIKNPLARAESILQQLDRMGFLYSIPPELDRGRDHPIYVPRPQIDSAPFTDAPCGIPHCLAALKDGPANATQLSKRLQQHGYQPIPTSPKILNRLCSYAKNSGFIRKTNNQYYLADGVTQYIPSF